MESKYKQRIQFSTLADLQDAKKRFQTIKSTRNSCLTPATKKIDVALRDQSPD